MTVGAQFHVDTDSAQHPFYLSPNLLAMLPPREADILRLRYGFNDGDNHSMAQIGEIMGYSRERIRQLQHEALNKLRMLDRNLQLAEYLD